MKKIFNTITIAVLFLPVFLIAGCNIETNPDFYCPSCNETIYWSYGINQAREKIDAEVMYGNVELGNFGDYDWDWKLHDECGWEIYKDPRGGAGDTLQLTSCNEDMLFIWRFQKLYDIHLSRYWRGSTYKGIRMGDSLHDFINAHSDFEYVGRNYDGYDVYALYCLSDNDKISHAVVEAYFMNGRLEEIALWE